MTEVLAPRTAILLVAFTASIVALLMRFPSFMKVKAADPYALWHQGTHDEIFRSLGRPRRRLVVEIAGLI